MFLSVGRPPAEIACLVASHSYIQQNVNTKINRTTFSVLILWIVAVPSAVCEAASASTTSFAFTISMENPSNHVFHVALDCDGLKGGVHDFKMPVLTPGYYALLNSAQFVSNFTTADGRGRNLTWDKISTNSGAGSDRRC